MNLAETSAQQAKKVVARAGPFIDALATVADHLKLPNTAKILRVQRLRLEKDTFRLPVLGRFRSGKSTFLNALLCELTHDVPGLGASGPLPVADLPTTAKVAVIDHGATVGIRVIKRDGKHVNWSLDQFQKEGKIRRNPEENEMFFKDIVRFEVRFPSRTLQSGITILDTPGTADVRERTQVVEELIGRVDAAIVLLRSDVLVGEDEQKFIQFLRESGLTELFFVINRRDGRVVDEDLKQEAWYRIVELCLKGPRYAGQDLHQQRIWFVDARAALEGRLMKDRRKVIESGLEQFEQHLSEFLEKERRPTHVRRFVEAADAHARGLEEAIQKMIPTIKTSAGEFKTRVTMIAPKLKEIERRKEALTALIDRYRAQAERTLKTSFGLMMSDLCQELPGELAQCKIPSVDDASLLDKFTLPFRQKQVEKEVAEAAEAIYRKRFSNWQNALPPENGARQVMVHLMREMQTELADEIRGIKREFDMMQFTLTGFAPDAAAENEAAEGWLNRVMIGAAAFIYPDCSYDSLGSAWRSVFEGMGVKLALGFAAILIGGPVGWAIMASLAVGFVYQALTAPDKLKEKFRQRVCDLLIPELRKVPDQAGPTIAETTRQLFGQISRGIVLSLEQEIAKEEETMREQGLVAAKSTEEKKRLLAALENCRREVARCRQGLQETLLAARARQL